jgi:hypothetical protein
MRICLICLCFVLVAPEAAELPTLLPIPSTQAFSFAILGDNRGDDSGQQPPAFLQVLQAADRESLAFVLDTGDMIYGHKTDEAQVREQWRIYSQTVRRLRSPIFHVPGNHDIWSEASGRIYRELWGKTYYAFDYGNSRFIGLDTETARGRLGEEQINWLEQQLKTFTGQNVFLFFHRPLFPVDGGIGSSLDGYPVEHDRIHLLFKQHRNVIRGVFAGHEHLYSFQERDGVPYYITGGGGAPLYAAPELGGFHHFLVARVLGSHVDVELRKECAARRELEKPRLVEPGEVLESWRQGLMWYAWDRTASIELTPERASDGNSALRLNFDLAQYAWPVLVLAPATVWDMRKIDSLKLDAYLPDNSIPITVTTALQGTIKHEAPPVSLKPGWNTITTGLDAQWFPPTARSNIQTLEWSISSTNSNSRGYLIFDNLRSLSRSSTDATAVKTLESWERPLLWRTFDETVRAEVIQPDNTGTNHGLLVHLDFWKCARPVIFAQLNPPWNLAKLKALILQVDKTSTLPDDLTIGLSFRTRDVQFAGPPLPLPRGAAQLRFELSSNWLPEANRVAAEQIALTLISTNILRPVDILLRNLSAASDL